MWLLQRWCKELERSILNGAESDHDGWVTIFRDEDRGVVEKQMTRPFSDGGRRQLQMVEVA